MRLALGTKVLAYAEGVDGATRQAQARGLLAPLLPHQVAIPAQALGELYWVLTRKAGRPAADARAAIALWMAAYDVIATSAPVLESAFGLAATHRLSGWDAVIVAAAADAGCRYLLSEDMQNGFTWHGVTIANPFDRATLPAPLAHLLAVGR